MNEVFAVLLHLFVSTNIFVKMTLQSPIFDLVNVGCVSGVKLASSYSSHSLAFSNNGSDDK